MSEFSDRPFVAGKVTGLRAFRIDTLGRLTGVTHRDVWVPGENQAVCHAADSMTYTYTPSIGSFGTYTQYGTLSPAAASGCPCVDCTQQRSVSALPSVAEKVVAKVKAEHTVAAVSCQCGFYAYFDGGNDYLTPPAAGYFSQTVTTGGFITAGAEDKAPRVGAIVNGWGVVTVGTRGFRAEKAQIVALISPQSEQAKHEVAFTKVRRNYPDVQVFSTEVEAVRAFPLTDPHPYSPETDEDFWTRSAS